MAVTQAEIEAAKKVLDDLEGVNEFVRRSSVKAALEAAERTRNEHVAKNTANQLRAIESATIERCAQVADGWDFGRLIADDIRALVSARRGGSDGNAG